MSKTKEFAEAAARAVARPVASAANMIVNPVETIEGLPGGVTRLFDRIELAGESIAAAATAPSQSGEQTGRRRHAARGQHHGGRARLREGAAGPRQEPRRRSLHHEPGAVQEAHRHGLGGLLRPLRHPGRHVRVRAGLDGDVGGDHHEQHVYDTPPGDLVNAAQAIFAATGASDAQVQALIKNPQYSLSMLTALARGIRRLQGVTGFPRWSTSPPRRRRRTRPASWPAREHAGPLPREHAAHRAGDRAGPHRRRARSAARCVVPAPVDYVAWTQRAARFAQRDDLRAPKRMAWALRPDVAARASSSTAGWSSTRAPPSRRSGSPERPDRRGGAARPGRCSPRWPCSSRRSAAR